MPKDLVIKLSMPTDGDPLPHTVYQHGEHEIYYDECGDLQGGSDGKWELHFHLGLPTSLSTRRLVNGDPVIEGGGS